MVNLADLDTSFLVPCRHCGNLLPEHDRICPHCGKDQTTAPGKGGVEAAGSLSAPGHDNGAPDLAHDGSARRRRKAIGVVAALAGVLLLGMAYDQYVKQSAAPSAVVQEGKQTPARSATVTGPVTRAAPAAPAASVAAAGPAPSGAAPLVAAPAPTPAPATPAPPAAVPQPACNEALAALSLCAKP